jgi:hypothetical protein
MTTNVWVGDLLSKVISGRPSIRSLPQIGSGGLRTHQTQELGGLNLANTEEMFD